jgi:hypothetical protein
LVIWSPVEEWLPLLVPEMGTLTAHLCFALTSCKDWWISCNQLVNAGVLGSIIPFCWLCAEGKRLYVCRIWYPILAWTRNWSTSDSCRSLCTDSFSSSVVWIVPILLSFPWNHDWIWRLVTVMEMGFLLLHPWGLLPSTVKLTSNTKMST